MGPVIIGGGPAGLGVCLAAMRTGVFERLLDSGLTVVEREDRLGCGGLGNYAIRSDSLGASFLKGLEGLDLPGLMETAAWRFVEARRNQPIRLEAAAALMEAAGRAVTARAAEMGRPDLHLRAEAVSAAREGDGWSVRLADGRALTASTLVLATGAEETADWKTNAQVAGCALPDHAVGADEMMRPGAGERIRTRLAGRTAPRAVVVGASHGAMSAVAALLNCGVDWPEGGIALVHRGALRITYASPQAALDDGFQAFRPEDVCPVSGRVFPLAGFRSDARDLAQRLMGLSGTKPEPLVRLLRLPQQDAEAAKAIAAADLVVAAFGYRSRRLPLFEADETRVPLMGDLPNEAVTDDACRVRDRRGRPVRGVFALGLSAGFPLAGTHGEPSFKGQANGLSLWHTHIGAIVARACLDPRAATAGSRCEPG